MNFSVLAFAVLVGVSTLADGQLITSQPTNTSQAWFCRDGPCPPYQLLRSNPDYDIRQYAPAQYVICTATDMNYTAAFALAFRGVYNYLLGLNSASVMINQSGVLVAPTYIYPENTTVSASVPLLPELLNNTAAPRPLGQNVTLSTTYNGIYAVASYGGVTNGTMLQTVATQLGSQLQNDGLPYNSTIYSVVYDGPYRIVNRHNEVWLRLTNFTQADLASAPGASAPRANPPSATG